MTDAGRKKGATSVLAYRQKTGAKASADLAGRVRAYNDIRARVVRALGKGDRTIPEIAEELGMASRDVCWYVMTFVRYGTLRPVEKKEDGYFTYRLREAGRK